LPDRPSISDRDRVLEATDLGALVGEHVALRPKGRELVGLCPFHDDRSPSMAVVTHKGTGFYKCFACGASGNAIDFAMEYLKLDFPAALAFLAQRAGVTLSERPERRGEARGDDRETILLANKLAARHYRRALAGDDAAEARAAIAARGYPEEIVEAFQLGYAPDRRDALQQTLRNAERHARESGAPSPPPLSAFVTAGLVREGRTGTNDLLRHRLVFPILDEFGRHIAFGGRVLRAGDEPKYLNSPESPVFHKSRALYGIHAAKRPIIEAGLAIVTEGYTDVIACHAAGVRNVVATLGTALTREHARTLRRLCAKVTLLFDGDEAGMRAADRAVEIFLSEPIDIAICTLPDGQDPDEVLRAPDGRAAFDAAIAAASPALDYLLRRHARTYRAQDGLSAKQKSLEAFLARLADLGLARMDGVRRGFVLAALSDLTGLPVRQIEQAIPVAARRAEPEAETETPEPVEAGAPISPALEGAERNLLALLLAHPELAAGRVAVEDGLTLPVLEAVPADSLALPAHRGILAALETLLGRGRSPGLGEILAECPSPGAKRLAGELGHLGTVRAGDLAEARESLVAAIADLDAVRRRERFRRGEAAPSAASGGPDLARALERIRLLRERGLDISAVPRADPPSARRFATGP